jgi:hypothetical protein
MGITNSEETAATRAVPTWQLDPFGMKAGGQVSLSRVAVVRIVCVAAETGARMQRDGLPADPLQWMITPLAMFHRRPPIEACIYKEAFSKAILLHGLGLDLNIQPEALQQILQCSKPTNQEADCD